MQEKFESVQSKSVQPKKELDFKSLLDKSKNDWYIDINELIELEKKFDEDNERLSNYRKKDISEFLESFESKFDMLAEEILENWININPSNKARILSYLSLEWYDISKVKTWEWNFVISLENKLLIIKDNLAFSSKNNSVKYNYELEHKVFDLIWKARKELKWINVSDREWDRLRWELILYNELELSNSYSREKIQKDIVDNFIATQIKEEENKKDKPVKISELRTSLENNLNWKWTIIDSYEAPNSKTTIIIFPQIHANSKWKLNKSALISQQELYQILDSISTKWISTVVASESQDFDQSEIWAKVKWYFTENTINSWAAFKNEKENWNNISTYWIEDSDLKQEGFKYHLWKDLIMDALDLLKWIWLTKQPIEKQYDFFRKSLKNTLYIEWRLKFDHQQLLEDLYNRDISNIINKNEKEWKTLQELVTYLIKYFINKIQSYDIPRNIKIVENLAYLGKDTWASVITLTLWLAHFYTNNEGNIQQLLKEAWISYLFLANKSMPKKYLDNISPN